MWWNLLIFTVAFLLGYLGAEVVRALHRPRSIANPYTQTAQGDDWIARDDVLPKGWDERRHTRPPGWHP